MDICEFCTRRQHWKVSRWGTAWAVSLQHQPQQKQQPVTGCHSNDGVDSRCSMCCFALCLGLPNADLPGGLIEASYAPCT